MVRKIQDRVASNSQRSRRVESNFLEVAERGRLDLTFARNTVRVSVDVRLYKRSLNDSLISGHSSPEHGSGRGVSGDFRGEWTLVEDETETAVFTKDGRQATRGVLDGQEVEITEVGSGTVDTDANSSDDDLGDESGRTFAWGDPDGNENDVTGSFRFQETCDDAVEFALFSRDGRCVARLTVPDINPTDEEEVRATVVLTVEGSGTGESVFTDEGEESVAVALTSRAAVGLHEIAFGTGTDSFDKSDTSLTDEEFRKKVDRELGLEKIRAFTNVYKSEPDNQPVDLSEISVEDNEGRMLWATTFDPEEKNDETRVAATVGFSLR